MSRPISLRNARPCAARRRSAGIALVLVGIAFTGLPRNSAAAPRFAMALGAGTPGVGLSLGFGFSRQWGMRVGYSAFDLHHAVNTSDVDYRGTLKLGIATALLDWYPFKGVFHLTAGVADDATKLDVVGQPTQGTYTFNGNTYTTQQIGSLTGQAKFAHPVGPYLGFGWGNPTGGSGRVHFLLDVGAIYGGAPQVTLNAQCGSAAPPGSPLCATAQSDLLVERRNLQHKVDVLDWYPVVNLAVAVRF